MKRPFALIGLTCFAVAFLTASIGRNDISFCLFAVFAVGAVISIAIKKFRQEFVLPLILISAAFSCLLVLCFCSDKTQVQSMAGNGVRVEATVCQSPYRNSKTSRYYAVCKLKAVDGKSADGEIRLSFLPSKDELNADELEIGDKISFNATVYIIGKGEKSIERYFFSENILLGAYSPENVVIVKPAVRPVEFYFDIIRSYVKRTFSSSFSDEVAGLLTAVLIGDKSGLDSELYGAFRASGVAHLMAVSGLHLSVWVLFLSSVIPENRRYSALKYSLLILTVLFIMLLAGMSESVKRAGFMSVIQLLGKLGKRKSDSLNNLGLSVFLMIAYNPACVLSVSLQLSFLSTLSILTLGKLYIEKISERLKLQKLPKTAKKAVRACCESLCISIGVTIFTSPVLILTFKGISTVSALTNIVLIPVITPLVVLSGIYLIFSPFKFIGFLLGSAIKLVSGYTIFAVKLLSSVKNAFLPFERENLALYLAGVILISAFTFVVLKRESVRKGVVTAISLLCCFALIFIYEQGDGRVRIYLRNTNSVVSVVFEKDGKAALIGEMPTYEKGLLSSELENRGVRLSQWLDEESLMTYGFSSGRFVNEKGDNRLLDVIEVQEHGQGILFSLFTKSVGIFPNGDLQQTAECDIIIKTEKQDIIVSAHGRELSLSEQGGLIIFFKENGDYYIRGENSWRNLMKSN